MYKNWLHNWQQTFGIIFNIVIATILSRKNPTRYWKVLPIASIPPAFTDPETWSSLLNQVRFVFICFITAHVNHVPQHEMFSPVKWYQSADWATSIVILMASFKSPNILVMNCASHLCYWDDERLSIFQLFMKSLEKVTRSMENGSNKKMLTDKEWYVGGWQFFINTMWPLCNLTIFNLFFKFIYWSHNSIVFFLLRFSSLL